MKRLVLALLALSVVGCGLIGTDEPDEPSTPFGFLELHLQGAYDNTPIRVELDGKIVLNDTVSTGRIIANAGIIPLDSLRLGEHHLQATVNDTLRSDTTFVVEDSLYVSVGYENCRSSLCNPVRVGVVFEAQERPWRYR